MEPNSTAPETVKACKPKPSPELELTRSLKRVLRHRTSPDALNHFLSMLNSLIVTALIKREIDRLDGAKADR